jgi:putative DNA primase/helicase
MTGAWADFATGDKGGDVVSLFGYLRGIRHADAARELARLLQVPS